MRDFRRFFKNFISLALVIILLSTAVAGCGGSKSSRNKTADKGKEANVASAEKPFKITIMTQNFAADPAPPDSPVIKEMEKYTNTQVDITWVPSTSYEDKLNTVLASGNLPMVVFAPSKSPSIINAVRAGAFWEVGPYLKDYPNLSKANPIILWNSSIDGKIYGIYRGRDLGRNGIVIRKDWLDNLGLKMPKTIDDFYNVLKAFTYNDPDKNGKNDTYGMIVTKYNGPFNIMLTWFGAPNGWGDDGSGKLVPSFFTKEYMDCLKFWKKMYDEKLFNRDFATVDPAKWENFYVAGKAGVKVDVLDSAHRIQQGLEKAGVKNAEMDVISSVEGPKGLRNLPTSGYSGMYLISKSSVKTVDELKKVLAFLDKLGDKKMQDLLGYGIEGKHYNLVNGKVQPIENLPAEVTREAADLNQLLMFIPPENGTPRVQTPPVREKESQVMRENEKIVVGNPAEPLLSQTETYAKVGPQLDNIIEDARVKFISGQIDEKGFQNAVKLWRRTGGDKLIEEVNELYKKYKDKMPSF
ncbi:extracellular solute-binding protein [Caldanaerobius polysaccharolyticus]|uniref:extracellular solute-binding protein n=1 Tax=Caldanaerobius polysaccharolyticus TaxID=44256 RepID=UPI000478F1C6|nr:extracellular solute-binding protein [Caldanaerobius polysaccharolyticus]